jgi:hypothetical protein
MVTTVIVPDTVMVLVVISLGHIVVVAVVKLDVVS